MSRCLQWMVQTASGKPPGQQTNRLYKKQKLDNLDNYSINDSLKIILDTCFKNVEGKFFGIICASGGEKSYLSTMHLSQICMNEWKMIQLPRIIYGARKDFENNQVKSQQLLDWIELFCNEFKEI